MICRRLHLLFACLAWVCCFGPTAVGNAAEPVDFNRDIRPILSQRCFQCHGPDQNTREADLRLDEKDGLFGDRGGYKLVAPGQPDESEIINRIFADDASMLMPPPATGKLSAEQKNLIRRWIQEGAEWQGHWAYIPATRPEIPKIPGDEPAHPIDAFIRSQLAARKLSPSPTADRVTLIRRLYFDLIGLPPTPEEVEAFIKDQQPGAYERLVDRLLGSTEFGSEDHGSVHFGERMAMYWLDLVRYADTNGIHGDNHRDVSMYRDYVIKAFNENKPFDEFTREQLAGDLLESPTDETLVASGYNRLLMTTREGGAQAKEYLAKYAADRVRNVSTVWMGATMGCAECHDHKFDPYLTREFYQFEAFFADIKETAVGTQPPTPFPSEEQAAEQNRLNRKITRLKKELDRKTPKVAVAEKSKPIKSEDILKAYTPKLNPLRKELAGAEAALRKLKAEIPSTLVSTAMKPRTIRILPRGNWLDDSGDVVTPAVPAFLPDLKTDTDRPTRLDLANWLVRSDHPLTARVFVNRLWKLFQGQGIVATLDDFGSQGAWPTHPRLLDWLAVEFIESGWNVKHIIRLMVTSETYKQSSQVTPELRKADPYNNWLARQSRFRLDAEMIRDNALAVSGLLVKTVGGPSVKPYQPAGYWKHLNFPKRTWEHDTGENQYRRGLYTYWCRTFLHPSLLAFDAPTREECTVERPRSNTPLQALVLLNDPTYVEASRALAERILREGGESDLSKLEFAYKLVLSRAPRLQEEDVLLELLKKHRGEYRADPAAAKELQTEGLKPAAKDLEPAEVAAWTSMARVLLNLHETIMRP